MPFFKQVLELQELIQQVSKRFATVFQELLNITLEREVNQTRLHTYQLTVLLRTFHLILFHSSVDRNLKNFRIFLLFLILNICSYYFVKNFHQILPPDNFYQVKGFLSDI